MPTGPSEGQPRATASAEPAKSALRARLRAARATRPADPAGDDVRTIRALAACAGAPVVAAYASMPGEPATLELIEALRLAEVPVMLPVLTGEPDWAWYTGREALVPGARGIPRPDGVALGADALRQADWIWLPGLAGTPGGHRLGTGGGWYDRALAWARPSARLGLLLFDDEVLDAVPLDPWDRDVHVLVTERRRLDCAE
ncbi:MAG TPA: 5-formyltetrahydrofolate cyclo-ligase [Propionicimonas sp.]|jgi:5-formyltetrahydrofolate cyclo-ligase|uniref:5-formyltetrahydrofolate cyclo-ligase n=1 Tax=Propionicimonas sp. TaxID=1955623 RepID=UPI002F3E71CF